MTEADKLIPIGTLILEGTKIRNFALVDQSSKHSLSLGVLHPTERILLPGVEVSIGTTFSGMGGRKHVEGLFEEKIPPSFELPLSMENRIVRGSRFILSLDERLRLLNEEKIKAQTALGDANGSNLAWMLKIYHQEITDFELDSLSLTPDDLYEEGIISPPSIGGRVIMPESFYVAFPTTYKKLILD